MICIVKKILAYAMTISLLLCGCSSQEFYRGGVEMDKSYIKNYQLFLDNMGLMALMMS